MPKPNKIDIIFILVISLNDLSNMSQPVMVETGFELKYVNSKFKFLPPCSILSLQKITGMQKEFIP